MTSQTGDAGCVHFVCVYVITHISLRFTVTCTKGALNKADEPLRCKLNSDSDGLLQSWNPLLIDD